MKKLPEPSAVYSSEESYCHAYRFHNIRMSNYEVTKSKYESVKPLGGQRAKHGVTDHRPLTDRHRTFEVWHKDGDRYGIAFARVYVSKARTDPETKKRIIEEYHKQYMPLLMAYPDGRYELSPVWMGNYVTWTLLGAALPQGLGLAKYGAKQYISADQPDGTKKYYYQDGQNMRFVPYESNGKTYYEVIGGLKEHKLLIDRDKTKKVYENLKPFLDYYEIMSPFIGTDLEQPHSWKRKYELREMLDEGEWLVRNEGEEYGERWMESVEALFHLHSHYEHSWNQNNHTVKVTYPDRQKMEHVLRGAYLYRLTKPYKQVAVDVGVPFYSNGRKLK